MELYNSMKRWFISQEILIWEERDLIILFISIF
jgi:hypothetical protein